MPLFVPGVSANLGETEMAAAAATSSIITFGNYKYLTIMICITGYASGGIFSLQFGVAGGAIDTGTNYRHRNLIPPATTATAWTAGVASSTTTADTMMRLAADSITGGRWCVVDIMNMNSTIHTAQWRTINQSTSDISHPAQSIGDGSYISTTSGYITSARLTTSGGNLNAGSSMIVIGSGAPR